MKKLILILLLAGMASAIVIDPNNNPDVISATDTKIIRVADPNLVEEIDIRVRTYTVGDLLRRRQVLRNRVVALREEIADIDEMLMAISVKNLERLEP